MAKVYLGLGSNVDAERNLSLGVRELRRRFGELTLSPVYRSAAVGFSGDDFLNLVAALETAASPAKIHDEIERIHDVAGRDRSAARYSNRPLDIDLLLYDDLVLEHPQLPREDVLHYSFVLRPLSELAPTLRHPQTGRSMREHWQAFDADSQPLTPVSMIL